MMVVVEMSRGTSQSLHGHRSDRKEELGRTGLAGGDTPADDPGQRLEVVLLESLLGDDDVRCSTCTASRRNRVSVEAGFGRHEKPAENVPSASPEALPGVTTPPFLNAEGSLARDSMVVLGRAC